MGWKRLAFLVYILICVTFAVFLAGWTLRFFKIESDNLLVVLFIMLMSFYGGLPVGLAYDRWKHALIDEKMQVLITKALKFAERGNLAKAEHIIGKLKSLADECGQLHADDIKHLESRLASLKRSKAS